MIAPDKALPDHVASLKAMVLAERARADQLTQIIKKLQRHRFGRRAETLPIDQLELGLEDVQQVEAAHTAETEATKPALKANRPARRRMNRGALPPRLEVVVDIPSKACPCCSSELHRIGEDLSKRLDIIPGQTKCWSPDGRNTPAGPAKRASCRRWRAGATDRGRPADISHNRPRDRRQVRRPPPALSAGAGLRPIELDPSTLADWTGRAAWLLASVHARLLEQLKASSKLFADETTAPVLDPGRGRTKTGQLWAHAR